MSKRAVTGIALARFAGSARPGLAMVREALVTTWATPSVVKTEYSLPETTSGA
eukprot:CAMPEP_0185718116 /NCGR_PEP_ID=MMETSP1164-20130828/46130_1 /TAXON_ID=1104430 /ORGANISM="Chrysoreinhardia sp, Strain CCMP2950" /LENGTH=52 /DNA_ID=CAMNT_0028385757 /DNA_START=30 /DNA_END=184 /DNA_ORIENTATION=+